jgi:hypothetical protein
MKRVYSPGITIVGTKVDEDDDDIKVKLSAKKAKEFIDATVGWLDRLETIPVAASMLGEIDASGHVVKIYRTWDSDGGNCEFGDDDKLAMVVPLDKKHPDGKTELSRVLGRATEDLSGRNRVEKFFHIGKPKPKFLGADAIAALVGTTPKDLKAMAEGKQGIPIGIASRLKSFLYDFLTPGPGSDCGIQFNHRKDKLSSGHKRLLPQSELWENRPPGVALGHELIHAWRCMVGRVLFPYGWEEEAMTVGLPPYSNMMYTENRFRIEWKGLAVRGDYKGLDFESDMFNGEHKIGINDNKKWLGDQSTLAVPIKETIQDAMAARRKAMGYDDEDDGF